MHICTVRRLDLVHVNIGTNSHHCYEKVSTIKYQVVFCFTFPEMLFTYFIRIVVLSVIIEMYFQSLSFKLRGMFKVMQHLCLWSAFLKVRVNSLT